MTSHYRSEGVMLLLDGMQRQAVKDLATLKRRGIVIIGQGTIQVRHAAKKKALGLSHAEIVELADRLREKIECLTN